MANLAYIDNSNLWIEGRYVSAVRNGQARNIEIAHMQNIYDPQWKIDFGKLFHFLFGDQSNKKRAALFASRYELTPNNALWNVANYAGFEPILHDRFHGHREKKIDAHVITEMLCDSYELIEPGDEITLVAGDGDYVPPMKKLIHRDVPVTVVFWNHASRELKEECSKFVALDSYIEHLEFTAPPPQQQY